MHDKHYTIGKVAKRLGISAVALRYYQKIGLLKPSLRSASGYRVYTDGDINRLEFILNAKKAAFTLEEIKLLLSVIDKSESSKAVKNVVQKKLDGIKSQIQNLKKLKILLEELDRVCHKEVAIKDCPIIKHFLT